MSHNPKVWDRKLGRYVEPAPKATAAPRQRGGFLLGAMKLWFAVFVVTPVVLVVGFVLVLALVPGK